MYILRFSEKYVDWIVFYFGLWFVYDIVLKKSQHILLINSVMPSRVHVLQKASDFSMIYNSKWDTVI